MPLSAVRACQWLGARLGCHSRQWEQRSPFLFLRGGGSALPSLQLSWGTCLSYRGPHFAQTGLERDSLARCASPVCISISSLLSWLASSVFENKLLFVLLKGGVPHPVPTQGILKVPLAHFPHPRPRKPGSIADCQAYAACWSGYCSVRLSA